MGNQISKRKYPWKKNRDGYVAQYDRMSPCSDSGSTSVVSIRADAATAKRLSQAESFPVPAHDITKSRSPCANPSLPELPQYSPCVRLRKHQAPPTTVPSCRRLEHVSHQLTSTDKPNIDNARKECRRQQRSQVQSGRLAENGGGAGVVNLASNIREKDEWMCGNKGIYQLASNPVKSRDHGRHLQMQRNNAGQQRRNAGGQHVWMPPESEQHCLSWKVSADNDSGRVNDRSVHDLMGHVNQVIKQQLSQPLQPCETYRVELKVTRVRDGTNPAAVQRMTHNNFREENQLYAVPRPAKRRQRLRNPGETVPCRRQAAQFEDLARTIRMCHEKNNVPLGSPRESANLYEELPRRIRSPTYDCHRLSMENPSKWHHLEQNPKNCIRSKVTLI